MRDFKTTGAVEGITYAIEFQLRKHGNYGPYETVEDAVNGLSNWELLQLIGEYLDTLTEKSNGI
jgi:hypothetical protein